MGRKIPDIIKVAARNLRKNMTYAEKILWEKLKSEKLGLRINRQSPIYVYTEDSGFDRYIIADFYCAEKKLIIEIDGSIHNTNKILLLDQEKEKLLIQAGYKIVRFKNGELERNLPGVLRKIQEI